MKGQFADIRWLYFTAVLLFATGRGNAKGLYFVSPDSTHMVEARALEDGEMDIRCHAIDAEGEPKGEVLEIDKLDANDATMSLYVMWSPDSRFVVLLQ